MKAGVSVTAASLVLNKKDHGTRVSDVCARRIREIAAEVGYVPNYHACSIKKGRSDTIAIALDLGIATEDGRFLTRGELAKPYFGLMVGGIEEVMRSRGCMVTIVGPDASSRAPERALIDPRRGRDVDVVRCEAAEHRANGEADAKGRAQHAHAAGSLGGGGDVADVGLCGGDVARRQARDDARQVKNPEAQRQVRP